jgi:metal-sulfur cluster biosynthetic enzyme
MSEESIEDAVRAALEQVVDPCSIATGVPVTLEDMGLLQDIESTQGHVRVVLRVTSPFCWQQANIREAVERAALSVENVVSATCEVDAAAVWMPDMMAPRARARLRRARPLTAVRGPEPIQS